LIFNDKKSRRSKGSRWLKNVILLPLGFLLLGIRLLGGVRGRLFLLVRQLLAGLVAEQLLHALGMAFDAATRGRGSVTVVAGGSLCGHS